MENKRKQRNIEFVSSEAKAQKLVADPNFKSVTRYRDDLISVERAKNTVYFNKPLFVGFSILEISKRKMIDFHYNVIKKLYPSTKSQLCFSDTDSYLYKIESSNIYADLIKNKEHFDFSCYAENHEMFSNMTDEEIETIRSENKKVVGKFKDESPNDQILEFVGLRPKLYSYRTENKEAKKCKGIKRSVVNKYIHFKHYKNCLFSDNIMRSSMTLFNLVTIKSIQFGKIKSLCQTLMTNASYLTMECHLWHMDIRIQKL